MFDPRSSQMSRLLAALCAASLALSAACLQPLGAGEPGDPLEQPRFLTPMAEAQSAGLTPYWMGERFDAGGLVFEITAGSELLRLSAQPGLELSYAADLPRGSVGFDVTSYVSGSAEAAAARQAARNALGATSRRLRVGPWPGEMFVLPAGVRPINRLRLFLDLGDVVVVGDAGAGGTGVPGTDPNPLIDENLLMSVMLEHLRPYPE